jgi:hypothetical protein
MMDNRPKLELNMSSSVFLNYYYLKDELVRFCKKYGLQPTGSKEDIVRRIAHYLDTGEKLSVATHRKRSHYNREIDINTIIESGIVCSQAHRAFFEENIGKGFSFNTRFQKWLKTNAGKTYGDAISAYREIAEEKKAGKGDIGGQFEYNTYIRDFFQANKGKTLDDAIKCWKYKSRIPGHNRYEVSDLTVLHKEQTE